MVDMPNEIKRDLVGNMVRHTHGHANTCTRRHKDTPRFGKEHNFWIKSEVGN